MTTTTNSPRTLLWVVLASLAAFVMLASAPNAQAQVPPHAPGSVCITPQGWCWAQYRGPVGGPCACPGPAGWVRGTLG